MICVGIDVSKDKHDCFILSSEGVVLADVFTIPNNLVTASNALLYCETFDAVNDLINGRLDCVIVDKNPALVFESRFEGQVKALDGDVFGFEPEEYAIALPKGDTVLADKINGALQEMMEDGTFDALVAEYIEEN